MWPETGRGVKISMSYSVLSKEISLFWITFDGVSEIQVSAGLVDHDILGHVEAVVEDQLAVTAGAAHTLNLLVVHPVYMK